MVRNWPLIFVFSSADSGRAVFSYWRKYMHLVLVNCFSCLCQPRSSVAMDRPLTSVSSTDLRRAAVSYFHNSMVRNWPLIFVFSSADSGRAVFSYWRKYMHLVLVNCFSCLCQPRSSVAMDRPFTSVSSTDSRRAVVSYW